ncbi:Endopolyphosphatase [Gamsiella multidivaricata]|nr:Endopolyphosphatase [Gamsiella multidivaricata]
MTDDGVSSFIPAGYYGAPNTICDSPLALADATFNWIDKNLASSIDFVVWTGDNARHDSDNTHPRTQAQINEMNEAMAKRILQAFPLDSSGKRLPIVPSIGNNDVYPHNIMYPGPSAILQHYSDIWSEFIPAEQIETFRKGGYYSSEVVPGKITVFGLNTLYFYIHNAAVDGCKDKDEPGTQQMKWLEDELKQLRSRKMVAYLTGHVPPEKKSYIPSCHASYTRIAIEFQDVIVGHLYGHANIDHFFLLSENKNGKDRSMMQDLEEQDRLAMSAMNEEEHDPFHLMGLGSYLESLWKQYERIPKKGRLDNYAVVQVSPSVIPTYFPTLRVLEYQLGENTTTAAVDQPSEIIEDENEEKVGDEEDGDSVEDELSDQELEEYFSALLNGDLDIADALERKKKGPKKPSKPVPVSTFGFPLAYTQFWTNLTLANEAKTLPEFVIEYRTREDYGLQNLGVSEWIGLARRIVKDEALKKEYLKRMVVQTGVEKTLQ